MSATHVTCVESLLMNLEFECKYGGSCLYTMIQWITTASVLQSEASANGTGE